MPVIDERGRLFGRVNLIDAIVGLVLLGLIPLAYGAFLLFRAPLPKITKLTPATVAEHQETMLQITGQDLRPFLEVRFGGVGSRGFLVQSPTHAEVKLPDLPAGTYDLTLIDEGQVLLKMPGAVTVVAPPSLPVMKTEVQVLGAFVGLGAAAAKAVVVGAQFDPQKDAPPVAQVLAVRAPEPAAQRVKVGANAFVNVPLPGELRVQAIIRLHCTLVAAECKIGETVVTQDAAIVLAGLAAGPLRFVIEEVRPPDARPVFSSVRSGTAIVRVRFVAAPEVLDVMKAGDTDVAGSGVVAEVDRAVLTQIGSDRQPTNAQITTEGLLRRSLQLQQPFLTFVGTVRVPVVYAAAGWTYKDRPVKVGAAFNFETTAGAMAGWVIEMKLGSNR